MKLHKRVIEDLMVVPGEPADLKGRSTKVTKSGWLHAKDEPSPKDLAEEDLEDFKRSCPRPRSCCTPPTPTRCW